MRLNTFLQSGTALSARKTPTSLRLFLILAVSMLLLSLTAYGQETTAGIQGTVKDPQGAVVKGATVEVSSPSLIGKKSQTTDSGGNYHFEQLPPGLYTITVRGQGFAVLEKKVQLETGALPSLNFDLKVGETSSTVEVSSETELVDTTQSKVQTDVTRDILTGIPRGRSFASVIPFAPGARQEPLQSTTANRIGGFQIDGASDGENSYLIDGINTTNIQRGGVGTNFREDWVQEVQVKSSSFEAEYGGAIGGVINAIPKRGSNAWHGEVKGYYQSSALMANDQCASGFTSAGQTPPGAQGSTVCGLRLDPTKAQLDTGARLDGTPQYLIPKKDNRHIIEPGYELGGPLLGDRVWLYSSYIPTLDTIKRTTTFEGGFNNFTAQPRELTQTFNQHYLYDRLDYRVLDSLRVYGSFNYAYSRVTGTLGAPDSAIGQLSNCGALPSGQAVYCNGSSIDPSSLRSDGGQVSPLLVTAFGGDWTPTSKLVVSAKYGYFFNNNETRGTPTGTRYVYNTALSNGTPDLFGGTITGAQANGAGFFNIPSTFTTLFDSYNRKNLNVDVSYFVGNFWGSHNFKTGYFWSTQYNNVLRSSAGPQVDLYWGTDYTPQNTSACDAIRAGNPVGFQTKCEGRYGYFFTGSQTVSNSGKATAKDQAYYLQDAWTVGKTGLTLNIGIRFDHEVNPAYDPRRFPSVNFGWGDKIAPRIGGAYDLLHNGKVKIYASYGKFFDIMKLGLTRGSFGSDYWHECVYALDTVTPTTSIVPTLQTLGGCPATGQAPGVAGRFIENVDLRATKADPRDPAVQAGMKPFENHEFVAGVDWAITPKMTLETRYSRKRLDNAIEDMSITDTLGFYVGNPGSHFSDLLHRPTVIPDNNQINYFNTIPFCAECGPHQVKAIRNYDGVEFRLVRRSTNWYGALTYTYSKLRGNYAGLTNTDPTDGGGGRHDPNNNRAFDIPTMTFLPNGRPDNGRLSTDRPNTAKIYGFYRLPWFGHSTLVGITQDLFQGTPINACLPVVGTSSACQWAEGRGNRPLLHRDPATGNIVKDGVQSDWRTPSYFQTDLTVRQEFKISQTHENFRVVLEANFYNLLNNHSAVSYYEFVIPTGLISPRRAPRFPGDPGVDWGKLLNGYNYIDALNAANAFSGIDPSSNKPVQDQRTLASRFGLPQVFQTARQIRLGARFVF